MEKWTRPWRDIESRARAGMQMLCLPRALAAAGGGRGAGGAENRYYSPLIPHSSFPDITLPFSPPLSPTPPALHLHLIHCAATRPAPPPKPPPHSLLTVESPKWQRIKHPGTEAPRVLINASLARKMITSRRGWVLDERRSSTNEMKISFLRKVGCFLGFFFSWAAYQDSPKIKLNFLPPQQRT